MAWDVNWDVWQDGDDRLPGAIVAVATDGEVRVSKSFGRDAPDGLAHSASTPFYVASVA